MNERGKIVAHSRVFGERYSIPGVFYRLIIRNSWAPLNREIFIGAIILPLAVLGVYSAFFFMVASDLGQIISKNTIESHASLCLFVYWLYLVRKCFVVTRLVSEGALAVALFVYLSCEAIGFAHWLASSFPNSTHFLVNLYLAIISIASIVILLFKNMRAVNYSCLTGGGGNFEVEI